MKGLCEATTWLPHCAWSAAGGAIEDREYTDFDAQSERLITHDQEYLQLSEGPFYGRFISCILGPSVSLHVEHANQALSQSISSTPDTYAIGVVLSAGSAFRANGTTVDCDSVFIIPPGADLHLYSPHRGTVLACVVSRTLLETRLASTRLFDDHLEDLSRNVACFHAPTLANRLRQDAHCALTSCTRDTVNPVDQAILGDALVNSFIASLTLALHSELHRLNTDQPASFRHFLAAKSRLTVNEPVAKRLPTLSRDLALSKRTLQYTFAQEVFLGLSGYQRHLRLHAVRRALCKDLAAAQTIGDVAAQHGFWNWSHFSLQYRQLFGERPSDTASRSGER